jgi:Cys-rich protein (TIGR01571 family)
MPEISSWRHLFSSAGLEETPGSCRSAGCENGLCAVFCPACHYGKIAERFDSDESQFGQQPECAALTYACVSPFGCFTAWLPFSWYINWNARKSMKTLVYMKENDCATFWISAFCSPCSNAQVLREVSRVHPPSSLDDPFLKTHVGAPRKQRMGSSRSSSTMCSSNYCK